MSLVIDASVFVASARATEKTYADSRQFVSVIATTDELIYSPAIVIPECAGAIARHTGSPEQAHQMVLLLKRLLGLQLELISVDLAESAADISGNCRLRGSDACYVALSARHGATLITWDIEMLERGATVVTTCTPEKWLHEYRHKP